MIVMTATSVVRFTLESEDRVRLKNSAPSTSPSLSAATITHRDTLPTLKTSSWTMGLKSATADQQYNNNKIKVKQQQQQQQQQQSIIFLNNGNNNNNYYYYYHHQSSLPVPS